MICSSFSSTSRTDLNYGATLVVAVDDMACELEELLYLLLLKVKAVSAQQKLPSRHRVLRHVAIHQLLTITVEA